jgi:hypothetical protein
MFVPSLAVSWKAPTTQSISCLDSSLGRVPTACLWCSTVLRPSHIPRKKVSLSTRARTQSSCTVSVLAIAFLNPVIWWWIHLWSTAYDMRKRYTAGKYTIMSPLAAPVIHIPLSRHTDLSLADWTRLSFVSSAAGQKTILTPSNAEHNRYWTTNFYTQHSYIYYKINHNTCTVCTLTCALWYLNITLTRFEPGSPASQPRPIATTLHLLFHSNFFNDLQSKKRMRCLPQMNIRISNQIK